MLTSLAMIVAMSEEGYKNTSEQNVRKGRIPFNKKIEIIPIGVKKYFFKENGQFSNDSMFSEKLFYKCFARNDKNAKRKFDNYRKRHRGI